MEKSAGGKLRITGVSKRKKSRMSVENLKVKILAQPTVQRRTALQTNREERKAESLKSRKWRSWENAGRNGSNGSRKSEGAPKAECVDIATFSSQRSEEEIDLSAEFDNLNEVRKKQDHEDLSIECNLYVITSLRW